MYIASSVLRRPPLRRLRCVVCRRLLRLFRDHSFFSLTLRQQVDIRKQEVRSRDRFPPWTEANQTLQMGFLGCQVCDRESKAEEEARGRAKARMSSNNDNADCNVCAPHPCTLAGNKRSKSTEVLVFPILTTISTIITTITILTIVKVNKDQFKSLFSSNCNCGICTGAYKKNDDSDCQVQCKV